MGVTDGPLPEPMSLPPRAWIILLVDDEPDILLSLKEILELTINGTKVLTSPSGAEALKLVASTNVDLVVSDFKMPGMDGIEFLSRCRSLRPSTPRVMLTAYPSRELEARARSEAGVDAFLWKAGDPDEVIGAIGKTMTALQRKLAYDLPSLTQRQGADAHRDRQR